MFEYGVTIYEAQNICQENLRVLFEVSDIGDSEMHINDYLDQAKAKLGSDSAVARAIGKQHKDVWEYRNGKHLPNVEVCTKLAMVLDLEPMEIISCVGLLGAKNDSSREFWNGFISQHRPWVIGAACLICLGFYGNADSEKSGEIAGANISLLTINPHYAKWYIAGYSALIGIIAFGLYSGSSFCRRLIRAPSRYQGRLLSFQ